MNRLQGFLALLATGLIFGSFGIFVRLLSKELSGYEQVALRHFFGFLTVLVVFIVIKTRPKLNNLPKLLFVYALCYPLSVLFVTFTFLHAKVAVGVFAIYSSEIFMSFLLGYIFFKEKLSLAKVVSLLLIVIGILFITYPFSFANITAGFWYGLLSGTLWAVGNALVKHFENTVEKLTLVLTQMVSGSIIAGVIVAYQMQTNILHMSPSTLLIGFIFGVLIVLVGYFIVYGFQNIDLNIGSIIVSSELIFSPLFAAIIFKEFPTMLETIGGVFIALAIIVPYLKYKLTS